MMKHQLIGIYQIITGIFGALLILLNIGKAFEHQEVAFTVFLGLMLFAGFIYSGYALFKGLKNGVKYSIIAHAMQSVGIIFSGTQYLFTASSYIFFIFKSGSIKFNYQLMPIGYNISEISKSIPFELKIFIVPIIFIYCC